MDSLFAPEPDPHSVSCPLHRDHPQRPVLTALHWLDQIRHIQLAGRTPSIDTLTGLIDALWKVYGRYPKLAEDPTLDAVFSSARTLRGRLRFEEAEEQWRGLRRRRR